MKVIAIGRSSDNDIVVNDDTVSRHHLWIIQHDDGSYTLSDRGSINGTFVNGKRVYAEIMLSYSDIVRIGNTILPWNLYFEPASVSNPTKTFPEESTENHCHINVDFCEIPCYIENHNNVVAKILKGESTWTPNELQHYQNYPSEVEQTINFFKSGVPISKQGCVYQSNQILLMMSWENYGCFEKSSQKHWRSNAVSYVAMVLTFGGMLESGRETFVAVAIVDDNNVDVAVVAVGDGVCETKGIYGGTNISLDMACDMAWGMCSEDVPHIDMAFLVGNHSLDEKMQRIIHNHFQTFPQSFVTYHDLLEHATYIYEGVLQGAIHDLLMMDVIPMPLAIRIGHKGKSSQIIPVLEKAELIPLKRTVEISMKDNPLPVQVEVLQGDFQRTINKRLWELKTIESFTIEDVDDGASCVQISVDIGSDGLFSICSKAILSY